MAVKNDKSLAGRTIAISGGGIGGASAALALALRGAHVELFERAREFAEVGAGLQIGPHGWRMFEAWGVLDDLASKGFLPERMQFRDAVTAESILTLNFDESFREHFGGRYMVIHRSDLLNSLIDAAVNAGAILHNGVEVTGADTHSDGVTVRLCDRDRGEARTFDADVLLGFDGIHSRLRAEICDDAPVASAYVSYRGTSSLPADPVMRGLTDVIGYIGPNCHFIQYPLRGGELLNQVAVFKSQRYVDGARHDDVPDDWGNPVELARAYDHCADFIPERLDVMWTDRWWQMSDREPLARWKNGRVLILGDAAHAPLQYLASGAVMAMEDAECFASYAEDAALRGDLDWDAVLTEVAAERQPRCARIQKTSRFWGELWHLDGTGRFARNALFREAEAHWFTYADWLWAYDPAERRYVNDPGYGDLPEEIRDWEYPLLKETNAETVSA